MIDLALPESVYPAAASAIRESVFTLLPEQENEISISEAEALLSGKLAHRTTACWLDAAWEPAGRLKSW